MDDDRKRWTMRYERVDQHVRLRGDDGVTCIYDGDQLVCTCIEGPADKYLEMILSTPERGYTDPDRRREDHPWDIPARGGAGGEAGEDANDN